MLLLSFTFYILSAFLPGFKTNFATDGTLLDCPTPKNVTLLLIVTNRTGYQYPTLCYELYYPDLQSAIEYFSYMRNFNNLMKDFVHILLDKNMGHDFPLEQSMSLSNSLFFSSFDPDHPEATEVVRAAMKFNVISLRTLDVFSGSVSFSNIEMQFASAQRGLNSSSDLTIFSIFETNLTLRNVNLTFLFSNKSRRKFNLFFLQNSNLTIKGLFMGCRMISDTILFNFLSDHDDNTILFTQISKINITNIQLRRSSFFYFDIIKKISISMAFFYMTGAVFAGSSSFISAKINDALQKFQIFTLFLINSSFTSYSNWISIEEYMVEPNRDCQFKLFIDTLFSRNAKLDTYSTVFTYSSPMCNTVSLFSNWEVSDTSLKSFSYIVFAVNILLKFFNFQNNHIGKDSSLILIDPLSAKNIYFKPNIFEKLSFIQNVLEKEGLLLKARKAVFLTCELLFFANNSNLTNSIYFEALTSVSIKNAVFINIFSQIELRFLKLNTVSLDGVKFINTHSFNTYLSQSILFNKSFVKFGACLELSDVIFFEMKNSIFTNLLTKNSNPITITDSTLHQDTYGPDQFFPTNSLDIQFMENKFFNNTMFTNVYTVTTISINVYEKFDINFTKIDFVNNKLISQTPNQIQNTMCLTMLGIEINATFNEVSFLNEIDENGLFPTDVMYINVGSILIDNSSILNTVGFLKIRQVKLISDRIILKNSYFLGLVGGLEGDPGGALFLSTLGADEVIPEILISNCTFDRNMGIYGGAIYVNEPLYLKYLRIFACKFYANNAQEGSALYIKYKKNLRRLNRENLTGEIYFSNNTIVELSNSLSMSSIYVDTKVAMIFYFSETKFENIIKGILFIGDEEHLANQSIIINNTIFQNLLIGVNYYSASSWFFYSYYFDVEIYSSIFVNITMDNLKAFYDDFSLLTFEQSGQAKTPIKIEFCIFQNIRFLHPKNDFGTKRLDLIKAFQVDMAVIIIRNSKPGLECTLVQNLFKDIILEYEDNSSSKAFNTYYSGGAILIVNATAFIKNCVFSHLKLNAGTALFSYKSEGFVTIFRSIFLHNKAYYLGTSLLIYDTPFLIDENYFEIADEEETKSAVLIMGSNSGELKSNYFMVNTSLIEGLIVIGYKDLYIYNCAMNEKHNKTVDQNLRCDLQDYVSDFKISYNKNSSIKKQKNSFLIENATSFGGELLNVTHSKFKHIKEVVGEVLIHSNTFELKNLSDEIFLFGFHNKRVQRVTLSNDYLNESRKSFLFGFEVDQCLTGEIYNRTFNNCSKCSSGSYTTSPLAEACSPCPDFATCEKGIISPKPNYWRSSSDSFKLYYCENNPENCLGNKENLCLKGSTGPKCESCDYVNGYVRTLQYVCVKCEEFSLDLVFSVLVFIFSIFFTFYYVYSWCDTINEVHKQNCDSEIIKSKRNLSLYLNMLTFFFQVTSLISKSSPTRGPTYIQYLLDMGLPTSLLAYKYCIFLQVSLKYSVYIDILYIVLFPIIKAVFLLVFVFLLRKKWKKKQILTTHHYVMAVICLFNMEAFGVIYELFSYLSCQTIDGQSFMKKDLQISCSDEIYELFRNFVVIPFTFLWAVIFPAVIFSRMVFSHKRIYDIKNLTRFGSLLIGYSQDTYFWEICKFLLKLLLLMISQFILFFPARLVFILFSVGAYGLSIHVFKPYTANRFNTIEKVASIFYVCSPVLLLYKLSSISFIKLINTSDISSGLIAYFDNLFLFLNLLFIAGFTSFLVLMIILEIRRKGSNLIKNVRTRFRSAFSKKKTPSMQSTDQEEVNFKAQTPLGLANQETFLGNEINLSENEGIRTEREEIPARKIQEILDTIDISESDPGLSEPLIRRSPE